MAGILRWFNELSWQRLALLLGFVVLGTRAAGFFVSMFNPDEATYMALASRLLEGGVPYVDAVDHKPALILWAYALAGRISGPFVLWTPRLMQIVAVLLTALCLSSIGELMARGTRGRLAGLLYAVFSAIGYPRDVQAANTELMLNLPIAVAALLTSQVLVGRARSRTLSLLLAGALTALAGLLRYQAVLVGCAWAISVFIAAPKKSERISSPLYLLLGFAAVAVAYVAWFWRQGHIDSLLFWGWSFNFNYMAALDLEAWFWNGLSSTAGWAVLWSPLLLILIPPRTDLTSSCRTLLWAWFIFMSLAVCPGGRFLMHYYLMILPPLCLLCATGVQVSGLRLRIASIVAVLGLVTSVVLAFNYYHIRPSLARYDETYRSVGAWFNTHAAPEERLFVWGGSPEIYYYAGLSLGTRFAFVNYHTGKIWGTPLDERDAVGTESHIVQRAWQEVMADLSRNPPEWIVDAGAGKLDGFDLHPIDRYPVLAGFVRERYAQVALVEGVPVYHIKK